MALGNTQGRRLSWRAYVKGLNSTRVLRTPLRRRPRINPTRNTPPVGVTVRGRRRIQQRVSPADLEQPNLAGEGLRFPPRLVVVVFLGQRHLAFLDIDRHDDGDMAVSPLRITVVGSVNHQIAVLGRALGDAIERPGQRNGCAGSAMKVGVSGLPESARASAG